MHIIQLGLGIRNIHAKNNDKAFGRNREMDKTPKAEPKTETFFAR